VSEPPHPLLLLRRLDGVGTVCGTNPSDGFAGRDAREDSHAGEHCPRTPAAAETADFDELTSTRAGEGSADLLCCHLGMLGKAEVPPSDEISRPRRLPTLVQIETVGSVGIVITALKDRRAEHARPVGQKDDGHPSSLRRAAASN
jgi:hypothetical protein